MGFYEDLEKSLMEEILIEKKEILLDEVSDMPATTLRAFETEKNKCI